MIYKCRLQSENKLSKFYKGKLLNSAFREQISRDYNEHVINLSEWCISKAEKYRFY